MADEPGSELERLRAEVARLRKYEAAMNRQGVVAGALAFVGLNVLLGPGLTAATKSLFDALRDNPKALPLDQLRDFTAALGRRVTSAGLIGLLFAAVPTLLLAWQNVLLTRQNAAIEAQQKLMWREFADTRALDLLPYLYDEICDAGSCGPKHARALRQDALDRYLLLRGEDWSTRADTRCNVKEYGRHGLQYTGPEYETLSLDDAHLDNLMVRIPAVGSYSVSLRGANLSHGLLDGTTHKLDLEGADLSGTIFQVRGVKNCNLRDAIVADAQLIGIDELARCDLRGTTYNGGTRLPDGFDAVAAGMLCTDCAGEAPILVVDP